MNLRVGVIGLGMMGRHHVRVLSQMPGVDVVALADPHGDPWQVAGGLPVRENVDELIDDKLDYCVVAVPTEHHLDVGMALAAAGVHALIEKPIADSSSAGRKLMEAFDAAGLVAGVGHIERFNPALRAARRRIDEGELGQLFQVATRRQGPFPGRINDVGVIKDLATHDIDLTAWLTGQTYQTVSARTAHRSGRGHEDLVAVMGSLTDGTVTSHLINWVSPLKERVTTVTGESGAFVIDTLTADLTFYANGSMRSEWPGLEQFRGVTEGDVIRYTVAKQEPLRTEHENFRDAVLGLPNDTVTLRSGLRTLEVAEAIIESAAVSATVDVVHSE
jgi:UDP-N-acetylglucosamine 3-dehydrogenase